MPTGNRKEYDAMYGPTGRRSPLRGALEGDIKKLKAPKAQSSRAAGALNDSAAKRIAKTLNQANTKKSR